MWGWDLQSAIQSIGRTGRALAAWTLFCTLLLRAMLPPGYMPDLSALGNGGLPLVICTGAAQEVPLLLDADGQPVKTSDMPAPSDVPCLFALLAALPVPLLLALSLLVPLWPRQAILWRPSPGCTQWPAYLRLPGDTPPRAPPAFI